MTTETLNKKDVRDIYKDQQRGATRLPVAAEILSKDWYRGRIRVEDLWKLNPQFYVGYRLNRYGRNVDDSGYLTYEAWKVMDFDSTAQSILTGFRLLRDTYCDPRVREQINKISSDLGRLPLENDDYPIILLNSRGVVPYSIGSTVDGVRRLISLFDMYSRGEIQDSAECNLLVGDFSKSVCLAYNAAAAMLDNKPGIEKDNLRFERNLAQEILFSEYID